MPNQSTLIGTVLLEAFWTSRRKDMIDLITPFINYVVSKSTSVGEAIDISAITNTIREEFGYVDIPESVIIKAINREKGFFERKNRIYFLKKNLDLQFDTFNRRKTDCKSKIELIGQRLFEYLKDHCRKTKLVSKEQCIELLQQFFSSFALQIGFDTLETENISLNYDEVKANYYETVIYEKKIKEYSEIL